MIVRPIEMSSVQRNVRSELATSLHGRSFTLPDFHQLTQGWPRGINPNVEQLRVDVDQHSLR